NYLFSVRAKNIARLGIEKAIVQLKTAQKAYDVETEAWHSDFAGDEVDLDGDGEPDSKWINLFKKGKLIGRYSVLVKDEEGKLNINEAGNLSKGSHTKEQGVDEGWKPSEIVLTALPGISEGLAKSIVKFRYGKDKKPGKKKFDDNKNNPRLTEDGIDNDGDWVPANDRMLKGRRNGRPNPGEEDCDEDDEGIDEPEEFCSRSPFGDDQPFVTIEDLKRVKGIGEKKFKAVKNVITTYSYDKNINSEAELRMNINTEPIERIKYALRKGGITDPDICNQIAVNIIDYRDKNNFPISNFDPNTWKTYYGIEETPYLNEIEASPEPLDVPPGLEEIIAKIFDGGEYIELYNPYPFDIPIGGWRITTSSTGTSFIQTIYSLLNMFLIPIVIPEGTVIPANGYYTIGDNIAIALIKAGKRVIPVPWPIKPTPSGCDQYHPIILFDLGGNLRLEDSSSHAIEDTYYGLDFCTSISREKNDPRVRRFYLGPGSGTPGKPNFFFFPPIGKEVSLFNWPSSFAVKNYPFAAVGELGDVHRGTQWKTINFWRGEDIGLCDQLTIAEPVREPLKGRININTASVPVLMGLPGIEKELAEKICKARPFKTIGEIFGDYSEEEEDEEDEEEEKDPKKILNKVMIAKGKDSLDNDEDGFEDEDDEAEEIFRRISSLITVRSNLFSIISLAQSIRDKNGNGKVDEGEILAEEKIKVIYDRGSLPRKIRFYKEVQ
ncbi:MAG: helix-hairpin-helix domain-containing protein, partial [Candidatus Omnitrophica bacterium]|nr:helix-hairpin-helix domain-containing protein [Candidatus Omnitrophota bacterium]